MFQVQTSRINLQHHRYHLLRVTSLQATQSSWGLIYSPQVGTPPPSPQGFQPPSYSELMGSNIQFSGRYPSTLTSGFPVEGVPPSYSELMGFNIQASGRYPPPSPQGYQPPSHSELMGSNIQSSGRYPSTLTSGLPASKLLRAHGV